METLKVLYERDRQPRANFVGGFGVHKVGHMINYGLGVLGRIQNSRFGVCRGETGVVM